MVKFLNTALARGEVEGILTKAENEMVIISPYIKISDDLVSRLTDAGHRGVKIVMICREEDLRPEQRMKVEQIPNLELRFNEKVHAKCFYNEESMVITSLNLYDSASGDNHEMGVLLSGAHEEDKGAFRDAKSEAQFIIRESSEAKRPGTKTAIKSRARKADVAPRDRKETSLENTIVQGISKLIGLTLPTSRSEGHCLRCGTSIPFNTDAPYCPACYKVWAKYKDNDFEEKFCHQCGQSAKTSMKKPRCSLCYTRQKGK